MKSPTLKNEIGAAQKIGLAALFAALSPPAYLCGQTPALAASGQVVREIDDPFNGARWILVRANDFPAGPGRLLLVAPGHAIAPQSLPGKGLAAPANETGLQSVRAVVRAGDRLIVEENSAVVNARLEAVALGPAAPGVAFAARLQIGGRVVRAVALAPGRAALAPQSEAWQ